MIVSGRPLWLLVIWYNGYLLSTTNRQTNRQVNEHFHPITDNKIVVSDRFNHCNYDNTFLVLTTTGVERFVE